MTTSYYQLQRAELHQRPLGHAVVQTQLTGTGIHFDRAELSAANRFELPFGVISTRRIENRSEDCSFAGSMVARHMKLLPRLLHRS